MLGGDGGGNEVEIEKWAKMRDTHQVRRFPGHDDGWDLGQGGRGKCGK